MFSSIFLCKQPYCKYICIAIVNVPVYLYMFYGCMYIFVIVDIVYIHCLMC